MGAALVTDGVAGTGRAMALSLAQRGFDVAVQHYGADAAAQEVVDQIAALGGHAVALCADLLDEDAVQSLLPRASRALKQPISVLVNNATGIEYDDIQTATRDSWDRQMGANLRAPFVLTQALARQAPKPETDLQGEPRAQALVVNMLDLCKRQLSSEFMSYTIAEMGLRAFTQSAALGVAPNVRVNAIGTAQTSSSDQRSYDQFKHQRDNVARNRGAAGADVIAALMYFLDAPAVTGQVICVDTGQSVVAKTPHLPGVE